MEQLHGERQGAARIKGQKAQVNRRQNGGDAVGRRLGNCVESPNTNGACGEPRCCQTRDVLKISYNGASEEVPGLGKSCIQYG